MSIWEIRSDVVNFAPLYLVDEFGNPLDFCPEWPYFEGQEIGDNWRYFRTKPKKTKPIGNFQDLDPCVLICDPFAFTIIENYLLNEVEVLPIDVDGLHCHLINIINVVDCLEQNKSEVKLFKNSTDVKKITRYVFDTNLLNNVNLFKIPQLIRTGIFATDTFRDKVLESGLTGLEFRLVY